MSMTPFPFDMDDMESRIESLRGRCETMTGKIGRLINKSTKTCNSAKTDKERVAAIMDVIPALVFITFAIKHAEEMIDAVEADYKKMKKRKGK